MPPIPADWDASGVFSFPIQFDAALLHLRQDLRDDWFCDALGYQDLFDTKRDLDSRLHGLLLAGNGLYPASQRVLYDVPKKGLGVRYSLETCFYDRFVYQAICTYLVPYFDPLLSHRVLSHRYDKYAKKRKYLFKNKIEQWAIFEGLTHTAVGTGQVLLVTDLINFYENISFATVSESFLSLLPKVKAGGFEKVHIRNAVATLSTLLERWGFSSKHGLPQNRDPSSFIANVVLDVVDQSMVARGYDYFRYVDDIRIVCASQNEARKALGELITLLRGVGMNINSAKTVILAGDSAPEDITNVFPFADDRVKAIDRMWQSKSRRVITRSVEYLTELLEECLRSNDSQSRHFRFAINRLSMLADANLFDVKGPLARSLIATLIEGVDSQAASTDQYCKILGVLETQQSDLQSLEHFIGDAGRALHSWQNYRIWLLLATKSYRSSTIASLALERVRSNPLSAESPAIFIFLSCSGYFKELSELLPLFSRSWPYSHQRHFLLSVSAFDRSELRALVPHLLERVQGTIDRARAIVSREGRPLVKPERTDVANLYEQLTPYD